MKQVLNPSRRLLIRAFAGALLIAPLSFRVFPGRAGDRADAGAFLASLSERAIRELTQSGLSEQEKEARLRALLRDGFDFETIGRFVLGRYWRRASRSELDAFLAAFEDMIVTRFLPLFADYSGEPIKVGTVRPFGNNANYFNVSSTIGQDDAEPVHVDWRVRHVDGSYKVVDIVAEGVSIAVTLRSEYGAVLKQNRGDVAALTEALRQRMAGS